MERVSLGVRVPPMAMPICLVGADVDGRPNFCPIAWTVMIDDEPPMIGLVMAKKRRTRDGMKENGMFSVNIPSTSMAAATDYCGLVSGDEVDKSGVFEVRYGSLGRAPMIADAPVSMECRLLRTVEFETTDLLIGEIADVHVSRAAVNEEGGVDIAALDLMVYASGTGYHALGERIAKAFDVGRSMRPNGPMAE